MFWHIVYLISYWELAKQQHAAHRLLAFWLLLKKRDNKGDNYHNFLLTSSFFLTSTWIYWPQSLLLPATPPCIMTATALYAKCFSNQTLPPSLVQVPDTTFSCFETSPQGTQFSAFPVFIFTPHPAEKSTEPVGDPIPPSKTPSHISASSQPHMADLNSTHLTQGLGLTTALCLFCQSEMSPIGTP